MGNVPDKDINEMSRKEFLDIPNFGEDAIFTNVVIVPTARIHDSGYRCMKYILVFEGKIVGCVGGYSDVVHPNGIANCGPGLKYVCSDLVPYMGLSMDCLKKSGYIRLMLGKMMKVDPPVMSDFVFVECGPKEEGDCR